MSWQHEEIFDVLGSAAPNPSSTTPDGLLSVLHSTITQFRVEFLLVGDHEDGIVKPHVVFHLTLRPCHQRQRYEACRLSMDYTGHGSTRNGGVLNLDAVTFTGSHLRATGSFGFVLTPAGKAAKVEYWIGILMGRHGRQRYPGPCKNSG